MLACIGQTKHPIPLKINNANGLYFHVPRYSKPDGTLTTTLVCFFPK